MIVVCNSGFVFLLSLYFVLNWHFILHFFFGFQLFCVLFCYFFLLICKFIMIFFLIFCWSIHYCLHSLDMPLLKSSEDFRLRSSRTKSSNFDCSATGWIEFLSNVILLRFDFVGDIGCFSEFSSECTDFIKGIILISKNFDLCYIR